ncbi:MAG: HIT family protein [Pseudomonadota bacterium]|nr:HIT family protein [Pseudomonadota bacterium]MDO7711378.1 HIT family protein [Pseudomonadota bacterium]
MALFTLDPRLQQDTLEIAEFSLCKVLLMNDARYPWVILVPKITGLTEIFQLDDAGQQQLMVESNFVAKKLKQVIQADKMNVAALGNVVSQLHIHHVARFIQDDSWPAPVWGKGEAIAYTQAESDAVIALLKSEFSSLMQDG